MKRKCVFCGIELHPQGKYVCKSLVCRRYWKNQKEHRYYQTKKTDFEWWQIRREQNNYACQKWKEKHRPRKTKLGNCLLCLGPLSETKGYKKYHGSWKDKESCAYRAHVLKVLGQKIRKRVAILY